MEIPVHFSDHMVVQRHKPFMIYGWSTAGSLVEVRFDGDYASAVADATGAWDVCLPARAAGGPYRMSINCADEKRVIEDIHCGDLWLCSGQSNMQTPLSRMRHDFPLDYQDADNPLVRIFMVPETCAFDSPRDKLSGGSWVPVSRQTAASLSAVSWFLARELQEQAGVAQGIINSSVGGTPIQSWMSPEALKEYPRFIQEADKYRSEEYCSRLIGDAQQKMDAWFAAIHQKDPGFNSERPWTNGQEILANGAVVEIPFSDPLLLADAGLGSFWFSRTFTVPAISDGESVLLRLGRIVDSDTVWINGVQVASTGYQYPPRDYLLPDDVLKPGENTLTVRVVSGGPPVEFVFDKPYYLIAGDQTVELDGKWYWLRGAEMPELEGVPRLVTRPLGLYNAMIAPLLRTNFSGVIWYQGESNMEDSSQYADYLRLLIEDWRLKFEQPDLPFVVIQLPNYGLPFTEPGESPWAVIREAQRTVVRDLENSALAVTIDVGEWNDIHPLNKKDVGKRAAWALLRLVLGRDDAPVCPVLECHEYQDGVLRLYFSDAGKGLKINAGQTVGHLYLSSRSGCWQQLQPKLVGDRLEIALDINPPFRIRYAWADNPDCANLCNSAGLPASPFEIVIS